MRVQQYPLVVVGSGLAGLVAAISLAEAGEAVVLLSSGRLDQSTSRWAQGGIAAATQGSAFEDSPQLHAQDTFDAGRQLGDRAVIDRVTGQADAAIAWLQAHGVEFTPDPDNPQHPHLTQEGGHSVRRVFHVGDTTGYGLVSALINQVRDLPQLTVREHIRVIDCVCENHRVVGVDCLSEEGAERLPARAVILATGGAAAVFETSTNPIQSIGSGIAMAARAGAGLKDVHVVQFHPTVLRKAGAPPLLMSESLRGEGAVLRGPGGERFMGQFDYRKELAPRDVVSAAIWKVMERRHVDHVDLDMTAQDPGFVRAHFPHLSETCQRFGLDLTKDLIPVAPAAHYVCGGVITDLQAQTQIPGLFAIGEVAYTGLHGANRLASNSLLECVAMGRAAAQAAIGIKAVHLEDPSPAITVLDLTDQKAMAPTVQALRDRIRKIISTSAGVRRTPERLEQGHRKLEQVAQAVDQLALKHQTSLELAALRDLILVAQTIVNQALQT